MSGAKHKRKGDPLERLAVSIFKAHGLGGAPRLPLSGSVKGYLGDVVVTLAGREWCLECKARGDGFRRLYAWLENRDALILRADRKEVLVALPLERLLELLTI